MNTLNTIQIIHNILNLPSNKAAKAAVSGKFATCSSSMDNSHSSITFWRKGWKYKQLARAWQILQILVTEQEEDITILGPLIDKTTIRFSLVTKKEKN